MVSFLGIRFGRKKKRRPVPEPARPVGGASRTLLALADSNRYAGLPLPPHRPGSPHPYGGAGQGTGGSASGQLGSSVGAGNLHTGSLRPGGDPGSPAQTPGRNSGQEIRGSGGVTSSPNSHQSAGAVVGGGQPSSSLGRDAAPPSGHVQPPVVGPVRPPPSQPSLGPSQLRYASPLNESAQDGPGMAPNQPPMPAGTRDAIPPAVQPRLDQDTPLGPGPASPASTFARPFYSHDDRGYRTEPPAASSASANQAVVPAGRGGGSSQHWGPSITPQQAQTPGGRGQASEHPVQPPSTGPAHVPDGRDQRSQYPPQSTQTQPTSDRHGQRVQPPPTFSLFPRQTRVPDGRGQQRPAPPAVSGYTNPARTIETYGQRTEPPAGSGYTNLAHMIETYGQRAEPPVVSSFTRRTGFTQARHQSEPVYYYDGRAHRYPPPSFSDRRAQQLPVTNLNDRRGPQQRPGTPHHGGGQQQQPATSLHDDHGQWPDTQPPPYPDDGPGHIPYNHSQGPAPLPVNRGQWSMPTQYPIERPGHHSDGHDHRRARAPDYHGHGYGQWSDTRTGHIPDGHVQRHEPTNDYDYDRVQGPIPPLPQRSAVRPENENERENGWSNSWKQTEIRIIGWIADTNEAYLGRRASIEHDFLDSETPAFLENRPAEMPRSWEQMPVLADGPDPGRVDMRMQSASPREGPWPGQAQAQGQRLWPAAPPNDGPRSRIPYPTRVPQRLRQDSRSPAAHNEDGLPLAAPHHFGLQPQPGRFPQVPLRAMPRGYHRPAAPFIPYAGRGQRPELNPNPGPFWPTPDLSSSQLTLREVAPPFQRGYHGPVPPFLPSAGMGQGPELDPLAGPAHPAAEESTPAVATSGDTVPPFTRRHDTPMPLPQGGEPSSELRSGQIPEPLRLTPILSLDCVAPDGLQRPIWNPPEREDYEYDTTHGGNSLETPATSPGAAPVVTSDLPSDSVEETTPKPRDPPVVSAPPNDCEDQKPNINHYSLTSSFYSDDEPMPSDSAPARADGSSWPLAAAGQTSAESLNQTPAEAPHQTPAEASHQTPTEAPNQTPAEAPGKKSEDEPDRPSAEEPGQPSYYPQGQSPTRRQGRYDDFDFGLGR